MAKEIGIFGGGGAYGAFTVGRLSVDRPDYDITIGTSTGALIATLVAAREFDTLVKAYSNIEPEFIFTNNPFTRYGKVKPINAIWRIIRNKLSLADTYQKMKTLITYYVKEETYNKIHELNHAVIITTVPIDIYPTKVHYFDSRRTSYTEFVEMLIASCSVPLVMEPVKYKGHLYVDGGIIESVPLGLALKYYPKSRKTVYLHFKKIDKTLETKQGRNMFTIFGNVLKVIHDETKIKDIANKDSLTRIEYLPDSISSQHSLMFSKKAMQKWIEEGKCYIK